MERKEETGAGGGVIHKHKQSLSSTDRAGRERSGKTLLDYRTNYRAYGELTDIKAAVDTEVAMAHLHFESGQTL